MNVIIQVREKEKSGSVDFNIVITVSFLRDDRTNTGKHGRNSGHIN